QRLYRESAGGDASTTLSRALRLLDIDYVIEAGSLDLVPVRGPVLVTANHPFGLLDGAILTMLLPRIRPDVRILANSLLSAIPQLRDLCIFVNPFGSRGAVSANASALKECLAWLEQGGLLAAFPAGEVAHFHAARRVIADPDWNPAVARLAQRA